MKPKIIKTLLSPIFRNSGVYFSYLFGSQATGEGVIASSDYDIAVFLNSKNSLMRFKKRLKLIHDIQKILHQDVDVIILNDTKSLALRKNIISEGILLYDQNDEARIDFELRVMNEYDDFSKFLQDYNKVYIAASI